MKKLIILLLFVFGTFLQAQTTSGWFTEKTQGQVKALNQGGYVNGYTAIVRADTTGGDSSAVIVSRPFGESSAKIRNSFMGGKIMVGIQIDTAFADVEATLVTQISYDGTTWYTLETLDSDTTPNVTGLQMYVADFTNVYAPYVRLAFNAGGLTIVTDGYLKFLYVIPLSD